MKVIAIVTGATSGVGREFVRQLDGLYYGKIDEVWAVARDAGALEELKRTTYAPVRPFAMDLAEDASAQRLLAELDGGGDLRVGWLVNSAGTGWFGPAQAAPEGTVERMVRLNCLALATLTGGALKHMAAGSRIVNVASAAAFLPVAGMATYAATKRFVLDLTRALNGDLAGTGIHACAVCPKALATRFWEGAGDDAVARVFGTERVYDVVRKAIAAVNRGQSYIVTAPDMKVLCALANALPYCLTSGAVSLALQNARREAACAYRQGRAEAQAGATAQAGAEAQG